MPNFPKPLVRTEGDRRTLEFTPGDIQSAMRLSRPHALVLAYARAMMCFALFVPRPRHILMIGLGGGSMARFCHRHFPASRITVLELSAEVIALRDAFLLPPDDARFQVIHADAAEWIGHAAREGGACFDVIVADGFDAAGLPPALSSSPFYEDCRRLLAADGVLAANVFSYDPRHDAVLDALDRVFDGRLCRLDKVAGNNRIVFAGAATQERPMPWLPTLRLEIMNRLCVRLILMRLASRSVFA